jgi:hypothetical protein
MTETKLTASNVDKLFRHCLFNDDEVAELSREEIKAKAVVAEGVMMHVGFHRGRLEKSKAEVSALLDQLDPTFLQGWSFLKLPFDAEGNQWGEHQNADQLLMLGLGTGRLAYLAPRENWPSLPGGLPYVILLPKEPKLLPREIKTP